MVVTALGRIGKDAVPVLHQTLREQKDDMIRRTIVLMLGQIGPAAAEAVPTLLAIFKDDGDPSWDWAGQAARKIDPEAAEKAGVP
jgi:hypothetical protein